jgi:hypothetical protein
MKEGKFRKRKHRLVVEVTLDYRATESGARDALALALQHPEVVGWRLTVQKATVKRFSRVLQSERIKDRAPVCEGCGVNPPDPPSKLCVGCQAYQEHQR